MNKKINILLIGANGYIGSRLKIYFKNNNLYKLKSVTGNKKSIGKDDIYIKDFFENFKNYSNIFDDIDVIINAAGIAHETTMGGSNNDYFSVNTIGPVELFKFSSNLNIKKFVQLSTIQVYGNKNFIKPIQVDQKCFPKGNYAISKYQADKQLIELSKNNNTKIYIVRLPLVLGDNPKGNLKKLYNICKSNVPLPFKNTKNIKSFITILTLSNFVNSIILNSLKKDGVFNISEKNNISTSDLIILYKKMLNKKSNLFNFPHFLTKLFFILIFKNNLYKKLFYSAFYESKNFYVDYNWEPKDNLERNFFNYINYKS